MISHPKISIVGVPKGGTTSLHCWLERLQGVNAATPKETFYFMDPDNPQVNPSSNFHKNSGQGYEKYFKGTPDDLTLDSTTHYFYQQTAIDCFSESGTKVCAVLRDPVRRLVSYFNYVGISRGAFKQPIDFTEFTEHLLSENMHTLRERFTSDAEFFTLETALDQGEYAKYVKRWQEKISPENFRVMIFEDLVSDRDSFLVELGSFFGLEISDDDLNLFEVQNESRTVRFPAVNRVLRSASSLLRAMPFFETLRRKYHQVQGGDPIKFDWDQHTEAIECLYEHYSPLNNQLSELIGVDLDRWQQHSAD